MFYKPQTSRVYLVKKGKIMKKSIKTLFLGLVTIGMLTGCLDQATSSENNVSSSNSTQTTSEVTSSSASLSSNVTSESTSLSSANSFSSSAHSSSSTQPSSSAQPSSSVIVKTDIVLTASKTTLEIGEELLINSNVEGVTLSTTTGATLTNGFFKATQAGTYVVTAHKDGN